MGAPRFLLAIALMSLMSCGSRHAAAENPLLEELERLVGPDAHACGLVPLGEKPEGAWICVDNAEEKDVPYWIAIERPGIDSDIWISGLRTPSGRRYVLMYDSNYMGRDGLLPRFLREACVGSLVLDMTRETVIQCLRSNPREGS